MRRLGVGLCCKRQRLLVYSYRISYKFVYYLYLHTSYKFVYSSLPGRRYVLKEGMYWSEPKRHTQKKMHLGMYLGQ